MPRSPTRSEEQSKMEQLSRGKTARGAKVGV